MNKYIKKLNIALSVVATLTMAFYPWAAGAAVELDSYSTLRNDANLVAYWKLEDVNATVGDTLTNVNTVTFISGKFNNGANFVRTSSQALKVAADYFGSNNATINFWLKINTEPATNTEFGLVWFEENTNDVGHWVWYADIGGTKYLEFTRAKVGVGQTNVPYTVTLGTTDWYMVTYTYDGTNVRGYLNGSLVAGPTAASGNGSCAFQTGLVIGAEHNHSNPIGTQNYSNSIIDDVALFTRALSGTEISDYYNATGGGGAAAQHTLRTFIIQ